MICRTLFRADLRDDVTCGLFGRPGQSSADAIDHLYKQPYKEISFEGCLGILIP
jgi:hypothetical protein